PTADLHTPVRQRPHADDGLGQLALSVARDTRDADDLTAANRERHAFHCRHAAVAVGPDAVEPEHGLADRATFRWTPSGLELASDHQRGERTRSRIRSGNRCDRLPAAKHGHT